MPVKHLFLFCGGTTSRLESKPKPLIKIDGEKTLFAYFIQHMMRNYTVQPDCLSILCDDAQVALYEKETKSIESNFKFNVVGCGQNATTFQKFIWATKNAGNPLDVMHFTYPDIFHSCKVFQKQLLAPNRDRISISATSFTSRFPRLFINPLTNEIRGISNYSSPMPANPVHVFAGDIWGLSATFSNLAQKFLEETEISEPSLEFDFFFWLINNDLAHSVLLKNERFWVDTQSDIERLLLSKGQKS
jgi:hypothetical protein